MNELEVLLPTTKLNALQKAADTRHTAEWPRLAKLKLFWLWICIHLAIAALSIIISCFAIWSIL
jgi:hypothetical protein